MFLTYLQEEGFVTVNDQLFAHFKFSGWTRGDVDSAINDLAEDGFITIENRRQCIELTVPDTQDTK